MVVDPADVIFAAPEEISKIIEAPDRPGAGAISMLMTKERSRRCVMRGWAMSVLQEAGAIRCRRCRSEH